VNINFSKIRLYLFSFSLLIMISAPAHFITAALAYEADQNPDMKFENQVRQIVSEEIERAFEKYSGPSKTILKPEDLKNTLIPSITDQVVKRSLALITSSPAAAEAQTGDNAMTLLKINDKNITANEAIEEYMRLPQNSRVFLNTVEKLKSFLGEVVLVNQIVIMEAEKKKIAERDEIRIQLEKAAENLMIETYYKQIKEEILKSVTISAAEINSFYEENKAARFQIKDCVTLANIFVKFTSEDSSSVQLARNRIEKAKMELDLGSKFEKVWEKFSDDRTHKNGVLGTFRRDMYNKNSVINEAFSRNLGEYTNIIKGNNGFYILKVLEKNDSKTIPLTDAKTIIEDELKAKKESDKLESWIKNVKAKYNIKIFREKIGGSADTLEVAHPAGIIMTDLSLTEGAAANEPKIKESPNGAAQPDEPSDDEETSFAAKKKANNNSKKKANAKKQKSLKSKDKKNAQKKDHTSSDKTADAPSSKLSPAASKPAEDLNEVLAEVDGSKITRLNFNESISQLQSPQKLDLTKASERIAILEKIINRIILKKEATLAQVQNSPSYKKEMKDIENKILARALIFEEITKKIAEPTPKEIKDFFQKNNREFRVRHILISVKNPADNAEKDAARAKAESIHARLDTQEFAQMAKQYSDDVSKTEGGLLPYFTYDDMPEPFSNTTSSLKNGEYSKPVLTNFGFHIIKLEEIKPLVFNDVKSKIRDRLISAVQKKALSGYIDSLKNQYQYQYFDENIKATIDKKMFQL